MFAIILVANISTLKPPMAIDDHMIAVAQLGAIGKVKTLKNRRDPKVKRAIAVMTSRAQAQEGMQLFLIFPVSGSKFGGGAH